jgi:hypothetical protein
MQIANEPESMTLPIIHLQRETTSSVIVGCLAAAALIAAPATLCQADDAKISHEQMLTWLRELAPLQKVHYSWPIDFKSAPNELIYEYARITHAVSVSGEWHNHDEVDQAVRLCKRVNETKPAIPATIGVNYSPWHRRFDKDLPPTDRGTTHQAELDYLRERLGVIRAELKAANERYETEIPATCVMLDSERFFIRKDDPNWNDAITAKYDAVYDIVLDVFPKARIEWYLRGAIQPSATESGWTEGGGWFTLKEKGDYFGCSLYCVPEIGNTRETFRRTVANAARHGVDEVTPWIALATGNKRSVDKFHEWALDWDYDPIYSWKLGAEVNEPWFSQPIRHERFAPWNKAKIVIFHPHPFYDKTPNWGKHFVAYVRGAHLIRSLPEVPEAGDD